MGNSASDQEVHFIGTKIPFLTPINYSIFLSLMIISTSVLLCQLSLDSIRALITLQVEFVRLCSPYCCAIFNRTLIVYSISYTNLNSFSLYKTHISL